MHRRDLLKMGAAALVAAPFATWTRTARADDGGPKRLVIVHSPNGTIPNQLGASGTDRVRFAPGSILEPLSGLEDQLIVLDGMDFSYGNNHEGGMGSMLTAGGPNSLDVLVGDHIGQDTRFPSLQLGAMTSIWGGSTQTRASYRDGKTLTPDDDPVHAFGRLFGDLGKRALLDRRQSIIDLTRGELTDLRGRLGSQQQRHLDAHLESLRATERSLSGGGTCEEPVAPEAVSPRHNDDFPDIVDAQIDVSVQALSCGATKVCTLQLSHTVSPVVFTWLGLTEGHHALSHASDGDARGVAGFVACERWYAGKVARLVRKLAETPDPDGGSLLDSTIVLWAKELGDSRLHVCESVPWVLFGGGDSLRTGRRIDLAGATHDQVLAALANRFGLGLSRFGRGSAPPVEVL